jgi:ribosomal protein L37E
MPITIADMIDEDVELEIHCRQCGKVSLHRGRTLLSAFGLTTRARVLQWKLRCRTCGMGGEVRLTLPDDAHKRERLVRGLDLHARLPGREGRGEP